MVDNLVTLYLVAKNPAVVLLRQEKVWGDACSVV